MVSLAAILSASSSAEASCPCSAASQALWWSLASSFVDNGVGRGGGSSVGFFVCLVVGFGVGYGRGSSVSTMGFPSASLSARSRVPPSKSQSDRMRSKASFEGTYVRVIVGWNAGEIFGIVVDAEEEEGHHRKATQINSVAGTDKGRERHGWRIGLAPKVRSYWETRRGRRRRGWRSE